MAPNSTADDIPPRCRAAIAAAFPGLAGSALTLMDAGWDSLAIDADDRTIFKFPRNEVAETSLRREAALLTYLHPRLTIAVPELTIHEGPPCFSSHVKIKGKHLVAAQYATLPDRARDRLAATLAQFYAELHALPSEALTALGATAIEPWLEPQIIRARTTPLLAGDLLDFMHGTLAAFEALPLDPFGTIYGFFDGHGWNMAFDHATQTLNGIYDFADSGIGPLSQDFIYSDFIATDLTDRILVRYAKLTGRHVDANRVRTLSGVLRLTELARHAADDDIRPDMLDALAAWVRG